MNVLFLAPYAPYITPSQRFRFEHYLIDLAAHGIHYKYQSFIAGKDYHIMFRPGNTIRKAFIILKGFLKRFATLFTLGRYQYVYIHREAALLGPPVFEWLIVHLFRKKVIYDFDDAIWIPLSSAANPIAEKVKCTWKVASICKWSRTVTVGNSFLASYAKQYCQDTRIIPTVVDCEKVHNQLKEQDDEPLTIGWTGTFTNFIHLPLCTPAIRKLQERYDFVFLIIADKDPQLDIPYTFIKWQKESEISDLLRLNIGIMPLIKTDVQLGKCAFKAIQYMSLGIPAVVTPIGANCEVVEDGVNGFYADNDTEWYNSLEKLILDKQLRVEMGKRSRNKIESNYSVSATRQSFLDLFMTPVV
ncbi:MAG TPA: glycosyltransferase family 4 protein [Ferruginibacter sp.]|nr:glycosyltransferase family 4 protein [Ferruginibacter sp.]